MKNERERLSFDSIIIVIVYLSLLTIGYFNLSSAVIYSRYTSLPDTQLIWIFMGVIMSFLTIRIMRQIHHGSFVIPGLVTVYALLILVLFFGENWGGSTRWFSTPVGGIQPSELSKPIIVLVFSSLYALMKNYKIANITVFFISSTVSALIMLEPDLGTAMVFMFMFFIYFLMSEKRVIRIIELMTVVVIVALVGFFFILQPYQRERITSFLNPESNPATYYQTKQSITMVASGGLEGKGYQRGLGNLYGYIPADHTDFILAVYGEEWGFMGMSLFLGLWLLLFITMLRLIYLRNGIKRWIVLGVLSVFFFQFSVNTAMVAGLIPVTGLPLPFFTYGGSSMLTNSAMIGMILWSSFKEKNL